jgi:lysozyme
VSFRPIPQAPCLALVHAFEGSGGTFLPTRGQDPSGNWAIGYGHDLTGMFDPLWNATLDAEQADALAISDLGVAAQGVCDALGPVVNSLSEGQYAACIDFAYNLGSGAFAGSTLCHFIKTGNMAGVPGQFLLWVHERINGAEVVERGLVRRRQADLDVWNS